MAGGCGTRTGSPWPGRRWSPPPPAPCARPPGSHLTGAAGGRRSLRRSRKCGILSPCRWRWVRCSVRGPGGWRHGCLVWRRTLSGGASTTDPRPGGLQDADAEAAALEKAFPEDAHNDDWVHEFTTGGPAQVAPPGFRKGLELGQLKEYKTHWKCFRNGELVEEQLASSSNDTMEKYSVQFDDLFKIAWEEDAANKALEEGGVQQSAEDEVTEVLFDSLRKFDGKEHRNLLPRVYIQMAARAGRRGLDNIGTVMILCRDEIPEESDLKILTVGKPTQLESQFRLTYTMILHLLRVEELKVEDTLERSFAEFHAQKNFLEKEKLLLQMLRQPKRQ